MKRASAGFAPADTVLAGVLAASPHPVLIHDLEGRVECWNLAAETLFGFARAESSTLGMLTAETRDVVMARVRAGERGQLSGVTIQRKDGEEGLATLSFAPVSGERGRAVGGVLLLQLSSGEGNAASAVSAEEAEALDSALGAIAHDLKNVLSAVRGFATVIGEDLPEEDITRADVEQIMRAVDRGAELAHRLLALRGRWHIADAVAAGPPPSLARSPRLAPEPPRGQTLLITEDDDLVRQVTAKLLRRQGFSVLEAASAADAEQRAEVQNGRIDLLVTDIGLPELSGTQLADRLTARYPKLKVLYMSGFPRAALAERGIFPGSALLEKPFAPSRLIERVNAMLGSRAAGLHSP